MAGLDNLDLLQPRQKEQSTHVHTSVEKATHVQTDVYVSNGGKCVHRHQILLDDDAEHALQRLRQHYESFNDVVRCALKMLDRNSKSNGV